MVPKLRDCKTEVPWLDVRSGLYKSQIQTLTGRSFNMRIFVESDDKQYIKSINRDLADTK